MCDSVLTMSFPKFFTSMYASLFIKVLLGSSWWFQCPLVLAFTCSGLKFLTYRLVPSYLQWHLETPTGGTGNGVEQNIGEDLVRQDRPQWPGTGLSPRCPLAPAYIWLNPFSFLLLLCPCFQHVPHHPLFPTLDILESLFNELVQIHRRSQIPVMPMYCHFSLIC